MSPPPASSEPAVVASPPCVTPARDPDQWFKQEVHLHDGQLKAWLRGQFPDVRDIDDVVQDSYLRIWKAKARTEIQSVKAFLFKVARHLALDRLRHQSVVPMDSVEDLAALPVFDAEPNAAESILARELLDSLGEALVALPAHYRDVIILHKIQGFSQKEVASQLRLSPKSVEKYVQRGLARCEEFLQARGIHGLLR
jgi:RNA polymerase sigma-70 factor (ECF subfamily)